MRAIEVAFVGALVHRFGVLLPLLQEHLNYYEEQLLPHVFMGDFTRWVIDRFRDSGASDSNLTQIFEFLEATFKEAGYEEQELIAVSFLENLPRPEEPNSKIRSLLGPTLMQELERLG